MSIYHFVLHGIDYEVDVTWFYEQKPLGRWCDSDWDAQGYAEIEYTVLRAYDIIEEQDLTSCWEKITLEEELEEKLIEMIKSHEESWDE